MSRTLDTITHSTTGVKTMTVGYAPTKAKLTVTPAPGASTTVYRRSVGITDGTNQITDSATIETTRVFQRRYNDRMAMISEWDGSAWVEVFKIIFNSFTATEFKYEVITGNSAFQVMREVES